MKPITAAYLVTARDDLREAGRSAYYAVFHAVEALIFERTGKVVETHSGVRSELFRLLTVAAEATPDLGRILNKGYGYKDLAGYGTGKDRVVTDEDATRFVAHVAELLAAAPSDAG